MACGRLNRISAQHQAGHFRDRGGLARDLMRVMDGEVRFDRGSQAVYANDASIYRQVPTGVLIPRHAGDVAAALRVCRERGAPVLVRGWRVPAWLGRASMRPWSLTSPST